MHDRPGADENEPMDPRAADLLGRPTIGQLGFHGLDGYPRGVPVWFEHRGGELLIASPAGAYKGRALAMDGRASLAVSTTERPYHIVTVVADATVGAVVLLLVFGLISFSRNWKGSAETVSRGFERLWRTPN